MQIKDPFPKCPACGVPSMIHNNTGCGWNNASFIILPHQTEVSFSVIEYEEFTKKKWNEYLVFVASMMKLESK